MNGVHDYHQTPPLFDKHSQLVSTLEKLQNQQHQMTQDVSSVTACAKSCLYWLVAVLLVGSFMQVKQTFRISNENSVLLDAA